MQIFEDPETGTPEVSLKFLFRFHNGTFQLFISGQDETIPYLLSMLSTNFRFRDRPIF